MSGQSSSPCWWVKDDSTSKFWHAAGVLNSMRYSHLLGSVTCTNSFVEPHRRFTYTSNTKQRFNTVSGWQCNFSLDLCTLIRTNEKQGDETRPWKLHWRQWSILGSRSHFVTEYGARLRICWALMWTLTFLNTHAIIQALCRCASSRSSDTNMTTSGPFLKRPGNFSGPKANFKSKTSWIVPQFLAHEPIKIASFTDSFIVLFSKLLKLWS